MEVRCLQISLIDLTGSCLGLCVCVAWFVVFVGLVVGFFLWGKFDLNHRLIPVVDRPCLALVRQCREKKKRSYGGLVLEGQRSDSGERPSVRNPSESTHVNRPKGKAMFVL